MLRYDEEEYELVQQAAGAAGYTMSGFAAVAALAAANQYPLPAAEPLRSALLELMAARTQVRRFGGNVNQAVRKLNVDGQPPEWLGRAVDFMSRAVARVDEAALALTRALH